MQPDAYVEMAEVEGNHWWFRGRRRVLRNTLASLCTPGKSQILEIGAGTGGNLALLRQFGSVTAVEKEIQARQIARGRSGAEILDGSLPANLPRFDRMFDVVCMLDVLEHVEQDVESLRAISRLLAPGGVIVLTVPAAPSLWSQHDVILHHKRRYTRDSLVAAVSDAGLAVLRITHFNSVLFPVAWVSRKLRKNAAVGTRIPPSPINSILFALFAAEAELLRHRDLNFGLSLLAVLSRNSR